MATLTPELIEQAMQLPADDRERLARLLYDSLDGDGDEPDTALQEELQRRWDRYQSGEDQAIPVEDFLAELRQRIDARKAT